jgi:hypothetical protein
MSEGRFDLKNGPGHGGEGMARRTVPGTLLMAIFTLTLPLLACAQEAELRMPLDQLKKRVAAGGVVVLDVRSASAFADGHIPGALSIPLDQIEARLGELRKANAVVAYCA